MIVALIVLAALLAVAIAVAFAAYRKPKPQRRSTPMAHVLHQHPADSPGYTRLILREPVGHRQASATVVAHGPTTLPNGDPVEHHVHLHGQREFDVPTGSKVAFPDGTELRLEA